MAATYSTSADDCALLSCFLDTHENITKLNVHAYTEVVFMSSVDLARSLSVLPISLKLLGGLNQKS